MKIYQITELGARYSHNPYLEKTLDNRILSILDKCVGANREKLMVLTGASEEEIMASLSRLRRNQFVVSN